MERYINRRDFLKFAAVIGSTLATEGLVGCTSQATPTATPNAEATAEAKAEKTAIAAEKTALANEAKAEKTAQAQAQATANAPKATETPTSTATAPAATATSKPAETATSIPGKQSTKGFGEVNHDVELQPGECINAPADSMVKGDVSVNGLRLFDDNPKTGLLTELPEGGKVCAQWGADVSSMGQNPEVQKDMINQGIAEMKATGCTYNEDKANGKDPKGCEKIIDTVVNSKGIVSTQVR
jgi:hypothetical protein